MFVKQVETLKLKNLNTLLASQQWSAIKGKPDWEQTEFSYQAGSWEKSRTFKAVRKKRIVILENALYETITVYDYFCYASTLDLSPWQTHKTYGQRATSETWIEEAKSQIRPARMHGFFANAAAFQSAILAYNTLKWMVLFTGDKLLKQMEVKTIRMFFIQIAAKLTYRSKQYRLNFNTEQLYATQWSAWMKLGTPFLVSSVPFVIKYPVSDLSEIKKYNRILLSKKCYLCKYQDNYQKNARYEVET